MIRSPAAPGGGALLRRLVALSCARPGMTLALGAGLAVLATLYTVSSLRLQTSTLALLPQGLPFVERYREYDREFGEVDDLVIAVEAPSVSEATRFATRLVQRLRERRVPLARTVYRIDPDRFEGRMLLYLPANRLAEVRDRIFDNQELLERFAARPTLDTFVRGIADQVAAGFAMEFLDIGLGGSAGEGDLRAVEDLLGDISARLDGTPPTRSPWRALFAVGADATADQGYFLSDDDRLLFILAEPEDVGHGFTSDRDTIEGVRAAVAALREEFPGVQAGVTGQSALSNDEMVAAFRDSTRATVLAFLLTLGLLLLAFRRPAHAVLMLAVLALSLCWSLGIATLAIGHLSLFSVMFVAIIIGIGIDYGIYILYRYREERALGRALGEALEVTAERTGPAMFVGALTSSVVFFALMLTDFRGIQELGFVGGTAIFLAWLAMMTLFPAMVVLLDRRRPAPAAPAASPAAALDHLRAPVLEWLAARPVAVLLAALGLTAVSAWDLRGVAFDYNLLDLQARRAESVLWERKIQDTARRSGFVALSSASSVEELRRLHDAFKRLPSVSEVDSALQLLPSEQDEKLAMIGHFAPLIAPVTIAPPAPLDRARLVEGLEALRRRLDILAREAPPGAARRRLRRASDEAGGVVARLARAGGGRAGPALVALQDDLYREFTRSFARLRDNLASRPVGVADLPPEISRQLVSPSGRLLLKIHPAVDIWQRERAQRFVEELRSVDPGVTGTAIVAYEAIRAMERAYRDGTLYAIVLVTAITALMLRRVRETALALLPLGLGLLWTVGFMPLLGIRFTMSNVFALPLLLGAASEYGLHVVLRHEEDRTQGGPLVARSMVLAILLNGLTTMVGFGSLMVAHHRGIFGLGLLLTLGSAMILVASLVVLPVLLLLTARSGRRPGDGA